MARIKHLFLVSILHFSLSLSLSMLFLPSKRAFCEYQIYWEKNLNTHTHTHNKIPLLIIKRLNVHVCVCVCAKMNDVQCLLVHEANIRSFDNVLTAYATPFLQQYEQNQNKMDLLSLHYVELLNSPFFSFVRLVFEFMMVCIAHCWLASRWAIVVAFCF